MDLQGAVAVVTGGASGIGRATALGLAGAGAHVVVADMNDAGTAAVVEEVRSLGVDAIGTRVDVRSRREVEALVDDAIDWQGHCDVFVSNAGAGMHGPPHKIPLEDYEWAVDTNLWPHIWATMRVLPHMLERGTGHLVHTASAAGLLGLAWFAPYCASKFAVVGLAESLALYCAGTGVGVSVVCPGLVATNFGDHTHMTFEDPIDPSAEAELRASYNRRVADEGISPSAVADAVVDAVRTDRFWVLPHAEIARALAEKWRDPEAWISEQKAAWVRATTGATTDRSATDEEDAHAER